MSDPILETIQRELARRGFEPGKIDGLWGDKTRDAVARSLGIYPAVVAPPTADPEPLWVKIARTQIGVKEGAGGVNSPVVLAYYRDAKHPEIDADAVPWCAAFVGACLARAGFKPSGSLMARSYLSWGNRQVSPAIGAVVVLKRGEPPAGHVGFYVGDPAPGFINVLGGNQSDAVNIKTFSDQLVLGYRWPTDEKPQTIAA